jgi:hypothetical protein
LHLSLASNVIVDNVQVGIFFLVAGITQVFWTLPIIRYCKVYPFQYIFYIGLRA